MQPVLCLVTDRARCGGEDRLVEIVGQAAAAGVHLVQVREKDLEAKAACELVRRVVLAAAGTRTRILVNDRLDVAIAAGADGVHLPASGAPARRVRAVCGSPFLIGRSVHSVEEALRVASEGGLDYLLFGTVFQTESKPGVTPAGLDALRAAVSAVALPVLAIGGVTVARASSIAATGAAGLAAIALFTRASQESGPEGLKALVAATSQAFDTPRHVP